MQTGTRPERKHTSDRAPTSLQVTSGVVAKPSRLTLGCTFLTASSKSAAVIANPASSVAVSGRTPPPASDTGHRETAKQEVVSFHGH